MTDNDSGYHYSVTLSVCRLFLLVTDAVAPAQPNTLGMLESFLRWPRGANQHYKI